MVGSKVHANRAAALWPGRTSLLFPSRSIVLRLGTNGMAELQDLKVRAIERVLCNSLLLGKGRRGEWLGRECLPWLRL